MCNKMTSKERVLTAINHKNPDITPCNYVGTPEVDEKLKKYFNTESMDVILNKLGVDLRVIEVPYIGPALRKWDDGRFENIWGQIRKPVKHASGIYNEAVEFPYAKFQSIDDVENFKWPKAEWFDYSSLEDNCKKYSEYAIIYGSPGNLDLINGTTNGRGVEKVMYDIALEDPIGLACMEKRFQSCYEISKKALETSNGKVDILWIGDDFGSQNGLLINPNTLRKLFIPKIKAMCELGHKYGVKVMFHSCGSTREIWPDLIEAGVEIYDTIQPEAKGMNPDELKKDFGDKICFHGTISTQKTLPYGSPKDVAKEVRQRIETVGKNGGFIVAPSHNIQPDTPIENILALYKEVKIV
jgi:uroporphyrinogen decarboxylase